MENQQQVQTTFPPEFLAYIEEKTRKKDGRPHFLKKLAKDYDVQEEVLNILESAWIKNRPLGNIAYKYKMKYHAIFRLLKELEPFKEAITTVLLREPRRRRWYIPELDQSDYETVQAYIKRAHSDELKKYKCIIRNGQKIWTALNYLDPGRWTQEKVDDYLATLNDKPGLQYDMVSAIRALCPQLKGTMKVGKYYEKIKIHKWEIFAKEVKMIREALQLHDLTYHQTIFDLHITVGAREGKRNTKSGMAGLTWDKFKEDFSKVDDFESKVRRGITWRDCPVDQFFPDLPQRLKALWSERGKPADAPLILGGYNELRNIYKWIRLALQEHYQGKIDPGLLKELTTIHPHSADKIHVNLLWEAGVPLEVVAGEYLGHGEGIGLVGRGWLTIEVIKKHYLSLTRHSTRFRLLKEMIKQYSTCFTTSLETAIPEVPAELPAVVESEAGRSFVVQQLKGEPAWRK